MVEFIIKRIKSIKYVFRGMKYIFAESAFIVHLLMSFLLVILGFFFRISTTEWIIQILGMGIVLTTEGINTVFEKICDFIHPDYHKKIEIIKDTASGVVGVAVFAVTISLSMIYIPYIQKFFL